MNIDQRIHQLKRRNTELAKETSQLLKRNRAQLQSLDDSKIKRMQESFKKRK